MIMVMVYEISPLSLRAPSANAGGVSLIEARTDFAPRISSSWQTRVDYDDDENNDDDDDNGDYDDDDEDNNNDDIDQLGSWLGIRLGLASGIVWQYELLIISSSSEWEWQTSDDDMIILASSANRSS